MEKKTEGQQLEEQLLMAPKNGGETLSEEEIAQADAFCEGYKAFLQYAKTEREAVTQAVRILQEHGYVEFDPDHKYLPGDKVYYNNRGKSLCFATIGTRSMKDGVRMAASHIDSPRVDLKPNPLYEDGEIGYLKTHYYGGIRKYQWTAIPLSLHGVIVKKDGEVVTVSLGDEPGEPVFSITDLLPHLSKDQDARRLGDGVRGEELNIVIGSRPFRDDQVSQKVKLAMAKLLFDKYGIIESDFQSADLQAVPAFAPQDVGLDRSMVGAYGQDDKVCAYTSMMAAIEAPTPEYTHVTVMADKEEVGSPGATGMKSDFFVSFISDLAKPYGIEGHTVLTNTKCLSADVNCAFDPSFPDVSERRNSAYVNYGTVLTKYTGSRGKAGCNEATAEFMGFVRNLFDRQGVLWQTGEIGKVDQGGGGTVAVEISKHNADVVDIGVPVLSMHSPFELVSKIDTYMTYRAFKAFFE